MCNIVEEYVAERMAEAKAELAKAEAARVKAEEKAATSKLDSIKNLMKNLHLSADDAMSAIGIPKSDFTHYLALLSLKIFIRKPQIPAAYFIITITLQISS